jgi:hypothetical protein
MKAIWNNTVQIIGMWVAGDDAKLPRRCGELPDNAVRG